MAHHPAIFASSTAKEKNGMEVFRLILDIFLDFCFYACIIGWIIKKILKYNFGIDIYIDKSKMNK